MGSRMVKNRLSPQLTKQICDIIRKGNYCQVAAVACGVPVSTFWHWHQRGKRVLDEMGAEGLDQPDKKERMYVHLYQSVEEARANLEYRLAAAVSDKAPDEWRAAAWMLERLAPKRWGQHRRVELTGSEGGPVMTEVEVRGEMSLNMELATPEIRSKLLELSELVADQMVAGGLEEASDGDFEAGSGAGAGAGAEGEGSGTS